MALNSWDKEELDDGNILVTEDPAVGEVLSVGGGLSALGAGALYALNNEQWNEYDKARYGTSVDPRGVQGDLAYIDNSDRGIQRIKAKPGYQGIRRPR